MFLAFHSTTAVTMIHYVPVVQWLWAPGTAGSRCFWSRSNLPLQQTETWKRRSTWNEPLDQSSSETESLVNQNKTGSFPSQPHQHILCTAVELLLIFIFLATFSFLCDPGLCDFRVAFKNGKGSFFSMIMHSNIKTKRWIWNFNQNGHSRLCRWCLYGKKEKAIHFVISIEGCLLWTSKFIIHTHTHRRRYHAEERIKQHINRLAQCLSDHPVKINLLKAFPRLFLVSWLVRDITKNKTKLYAVRRERKKSLQSLKNKAHDFFISVWALKHLISCGLLLHRWKKGGEKNVKFKKSNSKSSRADSIFLQQKAASLLF